MAAGKSDVRFTVPLYTQAEASRYLTAPESTFRTWAQGYVRRPPGRPTVAGDPLVTFVPPRKAGDPSIPFIGLAEGLFLSALRRAGVALQQIRPALALVRKRIGVEHALASRRLYAAGAQLLWEVSEDRSLDREGRHAARDLIVLRSGQYVFRQVIEQYLRRISYDEEYARQVDLPAYEVAEITCDTLVNFGQPYFSATGASVAAVLSRIRAGESLPAVAADYGLSEDQVTEALERDERERVAA